MFQSPLLQIWGGAAVSFLLAGLLALFARRASFAIDVPGAIQTAHSAPTPRVGGLAIYIGVLLARLATADPAVARLIDIILVAGAPALAVGLAEDITKSVGVQARLCATCVSASIACLFYEQSISRLDIPVVDAALQWPMIAVAFTIVAIAGVANSINIIDGQHGLASGVSAISLAGIAAVAYSVNDGALVVAAASVGAVIMGFWFVNFPWGKLFLGDGGAYFAGFALACLAVQLPARNPEVSPWASLLICGYPVTEVLYSVVRRRVASLPTTTPDRGHLHSLIAVRIVQRQLALLPPQLQNSAVSVVMWVYAAIPAAMGVALYQSTGRLVTAAALCLLLYHWLYRKVCRL